MLKDSSVFQNSNRLVKIGTSLQNIQAGIGLKINYKGFSVLRDKFFFQGTQLHLQKLLKGAVYRNQYMTSLGSLQ